jgi:hypothetical protein
MSEPKRYTTDYTFTGTAFVPTTREVSDGEYVRYDDYASLKAQVERLTKAGDAMADSINGDYNYSLPCIEAWNAAKEGKGQP